MHSPAKSTRYRQPIRSQYETSENDRSIQPEIYEKRIIYETNSEDLKTHKDNLIEIREKFERSYHEYLMETMRHNGLLKKSQFLTEFQQRDFFQSLTDLQQDTVIDIIDGWEFNWFVDRINYGLVFMTETSQYAYIDIGDQFIGIETFFLEGCIDNEMEPSVNCDLLLEYFYDSDDEVDEDIPKFDFTKELIYSLAEEIIDVLADISDNNYLRNDFMRLHDQI